jgi:hypothetical protein
LVRERVAMSFASKADIALNKTEADDPGVARIGGNWMETSTKGEEERGAKDRTVCGAGTHVSPPSATLAELPNR